MKTPNAPKQHLRDYVPQRDIDDMYDEPRSQGKADDQREIGLGTAFQQQMRVLRAEETLQDSLQPMRKLEPVDVPAIRHVPGGGGGIAPRPQVRPPRPAEDDWDAN